MKCLQQFVGATIESISVSRDGRQVELSLRLKDGSDRDLTLEPTNDNEPLSVRIDGQWVPPDEL